MEIHFGDEHLKLVRWMRGVYKVTINDKWFYIGSSIDLKRRLSCWKHILKHGKYLSKNGNLKFIHSDIATVKFEVLEYVTPDVNPKTVENRYIKKEFDNEFCLNISDNAFFSTKNKKPYGYIPKPQKVKNAPTPPKPMGYFKNGILIQVFNSVSEASRKTGCNDTSISQIATGKQGPYKKCYIFKYQNKDGSFVEPPLFINTSERPIKQYDINGNFIKEYKSIASAAIELKCQRNNLMKVLQGHYGYKTCKGFVFKYSDESRTVSPKDKYGNPV